MEAITMTKFEKCNFFENYLYDNCGCSLDIFLENYGKSIDTLRNDILNCNDRKEIKTLINTYI
jgi:hypothetical protein